ncbi:MAG TPA: hypothetical protein VG758_07315 [Hyphomicrobiaceae bacterium]|nr:hypothetical protein [Hyphomicrobiaceae bacterium]
MSLASLIAAVALGSCVQATLPNFDGGLLNPEIRHLRAGEIMEGVKCAMVAFMHEREVSLLNSRKEAKRLLGGLSTKKCADAVGEHMRHARKFCDIEGEHFGPYHINGDMSIDPIGDKSIKIIYVNEKGKASDTPIICGLGGRWKWSWSPEDNKSPVAGSKQVWRLECVENKCDDPLIRKDYNKKGELNRSMGISVWDYAIIQDKANSKKERGCVPVPDYSRLALDPNQSASIQLTLAGTNSGFVNFQRIDAARTGINWILPGNPGTSSPFPQLMITPKATTTFDMSVVMPQSVHTYNQSAVPIDRYVDTPGPAPVRSTELNIRRQVSLSARRELISKGVPIDAFMNVKTSAQLKRLLSIYVRDSATINYLSAILQKELASKTPDQRLAALSDKLEAAMNTVFGDKLCNMDRCVWPTDPDRANAFADNWKTQDKKDLDDCPWALDHLRGKPNHRLASSINFGCRLVPDKLARLAIHLSPDKSDKKKSKQANEFYSKCDADTSTFGIDNTTRIDFLGLKKLLHNVVEKQDEAIYRGVPDITLSALNLSSVFQLTMEAQAGTHFFKIIPVLAPPNTEIKLDHTHTLKITLNGKKGKGDKQNPKRLADSCKERIGPGEGAQETELVKFAKLAVGAAIAAAKKADAAIADSRADPKNSTKRDAAVAAKIRADAARAAAEGAASKVGAEVAASGVMAPHYCDTAPGQLLESIIQAQDKSGSGGGQ